MFPDFHAKMRLEGNHGALFVNILEESDQCGAFLIHHFLSHSLKEDKSVVFVGVEQSVGHYHAVGLKFGNNLAKARDKGQICFIEHSKESGQAYLEGRTIDRRELTDRIRREVEAVRDLRPTRPVVVMVDKLSLLASGGGMAALDTIALARDLQRLLRPEDSDCLVTLCRCRCPDDTVDALPHYLSHSSDLNVRVWPLLTGRSASVTGNLELEWPCRREEGRAKERLQFKLEERNIKTFAIGASDAVL